MCLVAFAISSHAYWPLVIAANRDEFLDRPTAPLARWRSPAGVDITSGRDLRAGGTWFGVTAAGRVAFLTNVREPGAPVGGRSRGELVTHWLETAGDAHDYTAEFGESVNAFAGFNLVLGDVSRGAWTCVSNRGASARDGANWQVQALMPGVYGLSNAALNTPWPKTVQLRSALTKLLTGPVDDTANFEGGLWNALASRDRASARALPATGLPIAFEAALSSAFVDFPEQAYGTRSSTLLTVTAAQGQSIPHRLDVCMQERVHQARPDAHGAVGASTWQSHTQTLSWPAPAGLG